jgi:hypothetical protein
MAQERVRTPSFENTINRSLGRVVEANVVSAVNMGRRLEKGLNRLNEMFYRTLAQAIVNTSEAPSLGAYSPPTWKPLEPSTTARKRHANFYYDSGELLGWLHSARAADILGSSTVFVDTASGVTGSVQGFQRTILRTSIRGKRWVQTLTFSKSSANGMRGFIKSKELERWLHPSLTVQVFSNTPVGFSEPGEVAKYLTGEDKRTAYKLTNVAGSNQRPIVSEFLEWWMATRTKRLVEKFGKLKGS